MTRLGTTVADLKSPFFNPYVQTPFVVSTLY